MRRLAILAACLWGSLLAASSAANTDDAARLFAAGNDQYAAGRFEEAARDYRQLLSQGFQSAAVHYNLGNALYKLGKLGPAILEYEKAARLAPHDPDVRENLGFLRSLTADKTTDEGARTTTFFVERLLSLSTLDQDAGALAAVYLALSALIALRILVTSAALRRAAVWSMVALAFPLATLAGAYGVKLHRAASTVHAIVLQERLDVLSGPGDDHTTLFTVHEGLRVRVRSQQGSWSQVSLDNGLSGWVRASSLGVI